MPLPLPIRARDAAVATADTDIAGGAAAGRRFDRRTIFVGDLRLNVIVEGEGPDVLLVHGFPDDHTVWRRQIPALVAAGYRVIAPDTRGAGDSDIAQRVSDYGVATLVRDMIAVLDALKVRRVRLVGHDWGAVIGWHLALLHPERVERYIALSVGHPKAYARGGLIQKLKGYYILLIQLRGLAEWLARVGDWRLLRRVMGDDSEFARVRQRLQRRGRLTAGFNYYRANLGLLLPPPLPNAKVPVVGLFSDGDRFLTEGQMRATAMYCDAGWTYVHVEQANHWLQLSAPARVNSLLIEHLR